MDNLIVMTTVPGARWILWGLEKLMSWAHMSFKPAKSRSLVLKRRNVRDKFRFRLGEDQIPLVTEKPVKSFGKVFSCSLKEADSIKATSANLEGWLRAVDTSGLPEKFKDWGFQHGFFPRILWPLLIYEVPMTIANCFESKVRSYLHTWLGLPHSLSSIGLYGNSNKLR